MQGYRVQGKGYRVQKIQRGMLCGTSLFLFFLPEPWTRDPEPCGPRAASYFAGTRWGNRGSSVLIRSMMRLLSVFSTWKNRLAAEAPMAFMNFL